MKNPKKNEVAELLAREGLLHDLRNVLLALALGLEQTRQATSTEERVEAHRIMHATLIPLSALILPLLPAGTGEEASNSGPLGWVLRRVLNMLHPFNPLGVRIVQRLDADLPAVKLSPRVLERILLNLGKNALEAMPKGGTLTFSASVRRFGSAGNRPNSLTGLHVVLTVEDTGPGIPETLRHRLFQPFASGKAPGRGIGLGLATVHQLVTAQGGQIGCSQRSGQGTVFTLYLPAWESPRGEQETAR